MTSREPSVTFRSPRSTDPMYVLWRPHRSASSSWEKPWCWRRRRRLSERVRISLRLGLRNLFGDTRLDAAITACSFDTDVYGSTDYE